MQRTLGVVTRHSIPFERGDGQFGLSVPSVINHDDLVKVISANIDPFDPSQLNLTLMLAAQAPCFNAHTNVHVIVKYVILLENQQFEFNGNPSALQVVSFVNKYSGDTYYFAVTGVIV